MAACERIRFWALGSLLLMSLFLTEISCEKLVKNDVQPVEGRLQSYDSYWYNDVYYWWPWFNDMATVIMIKLKIAIGLAAIYAFGDGYYWKKFKGSKHEGEEILARYPWTNQNYYIEETVAPKKCFWDFLKGWGHRYARSLQNQEPDFADWMFNVMGVPEGDCRKRIVCELDFDAGRNRSAGSKFEYDLFKNYRAKIPSRREDCETTFNRCRLVKNSKNKT
ncbi:uncharacterized protein LOC129751984 [Uranotaenia lowii]|uniref:uncharacterized protein LOC129751984 n=1 Tax=Uranotaenia lowii TaxID=190385 RepID=UPI0024791CBE|nr:uncharacterized protein LOC129751984 [Uranotaenia lowii]